MPRTPIALLAAFSAAALLAACGGGSSGGQTATEQAVPESTIPSATPVSQRRLPLGDGKVAERASRGEILSCGADSTDASPFATGPWIDEGAGTWDATEKVTVPGAERLPWQFNQDRSGPDLILLGDGLPRHPAGVFPVPSDDPAYEYDPSSQELVSYTLRVALPRRPARADQPSCLGAIVGVLKNGVPLYGALDGQDQDAVARLAVDRCGGHGSDDGQYHYHAVSACVEGPPQPDSSTFVGWALDGFGIYVERDSEGRMLSTADLDACHGRTSEVEWEGRRQTIYHYDASPDYPYVIGCYRGTPVDDAALDISGTGTASSTQY